MIKASCKDGVRHRGMKYREQIMRKIVLSQVVVLARPPDVAHQGSETPDFVHRCAPLSHTLTRILLMK